MGSAIIHLLGVAAANESHDPGAVDPDSKKLLEDVVARVARHMEKVEAEREKYLAKMQHELLGAIFRRYLSGEIETQAELKDALQEFFTSLRIELEQEDLSAFSPARSVISGEHRGPLQFAKFVLGRLHKKVSAR